jgi:molybdenum cofactor guanylyltransferase
MGAAHPPVAGAVLAGGASRRMGRTKALARVRGVAMGERVAVALERAGCRPVVFVGGDPTELAVLGRDVIADRHPGAGPLGGVVTALHALRGDVVVAACDLPELDTATVRALLEAPAEEDTAVIVAVTDRLEPGLTYWRGAALAAVETLFATGERALHAAVLGLPHVEVRVGSSALRNVNTPVDLAACET